MLLNKTRPPSLASFPSKWLKANCQATDSVGDCVCIAAEYTGGRYQVTKADPTDINRMPAVGVIVAKTTDTNCKVQFLGEMNGSLYSGLPIGKPLFVGADGRLSAAVPNPPVAGYAFAQAMGLSGASSRVVLVPNFFMTKRIS